MKRLAVIQTKINHRKTMEALQEKAELDRIQQLKERFDLWQDIPEAAYGIWMLMRFKTLPEQLRIHQQLTNNIALELSDITSFIDRMAKLPTDCYDGFIPENWDGSDPFLELREAGIELPGWTEDYLE